MNITVFWRHDQQSQTKETNKKKARCTIGDEDINENGAMKLILFINCAIKSLNFGLFNEIPRTIFSFLSFSSKKKQRLLWKCMCMSN